MKTATLPSIRVEPVLRDQLVGVLREDETLSAFVETAVRENLQRRLDQAAFLQRGINALASAQRTGHYVTVRPWFANSKTSWRLPSERGNSARRLPCPNDLRGSADRRGAGRSGPAV